MWPQTLEMSRDECRGMLRRLELESYSHIISVFRAQGVLSESKAKLLEELRQLFHITQERHRAEVRRAANDEQLCTIAENVCGPNTWQEWSREGRRPYPLLPRISPQTALTIVANDLAAKAYAENAKLPPPHETGANLSDALLEQVNYQTLKHGFNKIQDPPHVIMEEPFKVPDLPNEVKKANLKRKENEAGDAKPNKKRNTQHDKHLGLTQQGPNQPSSSKDDDGQIMPLEQRPSARTLQQRYFYQQQQKHKHRLASKKGSGNTLSNHSGLAGVGVNTKPAKSGRRRAQKQLQQQLQQKQQQQQQQQHQQQLLLQQQHQDQHHKVLLPGEPAPQLNANHLVQPHVEYILDEALKKAVPATRIVYGPPEVLSPTAPRAFVNSPVVFKEKLSPTAIQQAPLSSPVKKYIVEERLTLPQSPANISTANLPLAPQIISVQQIAAPPKVRTTSSSILPPVTKLTSKKINLLDKQQVASVPNTAVRLMPYEQQQQLSTQPQQPCSMPIPIPIPTPATSNLSNKQQATAAVQKYIVEDRVSSQNQTGQSIVTPLSSASAVNILKNIPASSLNNTLITPLSNAVTQVAPLFRKAPATTTTVTSVAASTSQLLGNIKLTSAGSIKHVPSSALRNIKICSPNGKVFLQPAKLSAGSIIHKLNTANVGTTSVGGTAVTVSSAALSPTGAAQPTSPQATQQRITIQKMQLLTPTQVISSAAGGTSSVSVVTSSSITSSGTKVKPTTLTLGAAGVGKNNLVFLPTSGMRAVTLASNKLKTSTELQLTAKPNVLVIGPASVANAVNSAPQTPVATTSVLGKAHQLITEDTPIDIINMPIIVADNGTTETKTTAKSAPMMVLNATDWEMELDQASKVAVGASSNASTTAANTSSLTNAKQALDDVIVEDAGEELDESATQINNSIIELQEDDDSAIEYVDMELEQPIEIESTSNISPETIASISSSNSTTTTTSLKATIMQPTTQEQPMLLEQATTVEATTTSVLP